MTQQSSWARLRNVSSIIFRSTDSVRRSVAYDLSIVGAAGLPAAYGGFETVAEELTTRLARRYRLQVFCTSRGRQELPSDYLGADLCYVGFDANGWQSIPYDFISLWRAARQSRAILVLGVSGCLLLPLLRFRAPRVRIVTNIDGLEWKRRKWGFLARMILRLSEQCAVRFSDVVVADNQAIRDHVHQAYGRDSRLIAYGGDVEPAAAPVTHARPPDTCFGPHSYFLAVCRIEPENNIADILAAFSTTPSARIVVVGNWAVSRYARELRTRYTARNNIELLDPIYDQGRLDTLRKGARAYIHGHSAGGTNPSLVEAMCAGMSVLAFDINYNRYTTDSKANYWSTAVELAHLVSTLGEAELLKNARAMQQYAWRHYTWHKVATEYEAVLFPLVER